MDNKSLLEMVNFVQKHRKMSDKEKSKQYLELVNQYLTNVNESNVYEKLMAYRMACAKIGLSDTEPLKRYLTGFELSDITKSFKPENNTKEFVDWYLEVGLYWEDNRTKEEILCNGRKEFIKEFFEELWDSNIIPSILLTIIIFCALIFFEPNLQQR